MRARLLVIGCVGLVVIAAVVYVVSRSGSSSRPQTDGEVVRIALADLPEGVSADEVSGHHFFVVRRGNAFTVFVDDARHLPGERLWWCPSEGVFVAPTHGEMFNMRGRKIGAGPAQGDMKRYAAMVEGTQLVIELSHTKGGALRRGPLPPAPASYGRWNSGPGSFCDGAESTA